MVEVVSVEVKLADNDRGPHQSDGGKAACACHVPSSCRREDVPEFRCRVKASSILGTSLRIRAARMFMTLSLEGSIKATALHCLPRACCPGEVLITGLPRDTDEDPAVFSSPRHTKVGNVLHRSRFGRCLKTWGGSP